MKPLFRMRSPAGKFAAAERVEVLRYDPRRRRLARIAMGAIAVVAVLLAFLAGRSSVSGERSGATMGELEAALRARSDEVRILEQQVSNLQAAASISAAATGQLRSTLSETQAAVERLSREGELYRSLMDTSVRTHGLTLHRLGIRQGSAPGTFLYRVTLLQRAQKHVQLAGRLSLVVNGLSGGKSASVEVPAKPLDMLYFQTVEGEFRLPDGFEARTVRLRVEAGKARPQRLDLTQDWKLEEG